MSASSFRKTFPIREVSAESGTGFDAESDVEKDGKRREKDEKRRVKDEKRGKYSDCLSIQYRYRGGFRQIG